MDDDDFDLDVGMTSGNHDEDVSLPKATVAKLIAEMLPNDVACDKEARDLLLECCTGVLLAVAIGFYSKTEFVHVIASEANDICEKTTKKTITGEMILQALQNLGFQQYMEQVQAEMSELKQTQKERKKTTANKLHLSGMSEEELIRQQEDLFKKARERYEQNLASEATSAVSESHGELSGI